MRNLIRRVGVFVATVVLATSLIGNGVYASDQVFDSDASGNYFGAGDTVDTSSLGIKKIDNEVFLAGMNVNLDDVSVDGSAFVAGNNVSITDANIGGSVFAAGNTVKIDVKANNNIWAAGSAITLTNDTKVKGAHIVGANITCGGDYDALDLCADTVTLNANVKGDVKIVADNVIIGENAKVSGDLKIVSKVEPENASEIVKGSYTFEESTENSDAEDSNSSLIPGLKGIGKTAGKAAVGIVILKKIKRIVLNLFKFALVALVFSIVFKKNLAEAYETATKKTGVHLGIGAATVLFFPVVAIILCITVIGLPLAGLLTAFYVLALCFAWVFTFASFVREIIFTHTSKRLNPIAETVLAVLPAAVIKEIPFVGALAGFACAMYTLGYVVLAIVKTIKENKIDG